MFNNLEIVSALGFFRSINFTNSYIGYENNTKYISFKDVFAFNIIQMKNKIVKHKDNQVDKLFERIRNFVNKRYKKIKIGIEINAKTSTYPTKITGDNERSKYPRSVQ
ncbi:hypothetical protein JH146_0628 [Methanocaldococcus bathoardescens]|uniref:Uncharacterized protein n=1 Tax=Methanocaldococcus bathoardescens TaxID=1301915 RepID=A0A076LF62_9EURY|nr:hypothetical protein JH146_0628 [Methanocaldococcus bathoardescens]